MLKSPQSILVKYKIRVCPWQGGYCSRSCSSVDFKGNVVLCSEHSNPRGLFTRKRSVAH